MIINQLVPQASTYAEDIDFVWEFIFWLVGFWTVACFAVFFYFIFKFRAKDGVKAQYITGETKEQKKFVSVPHALVLICDVFVIALAVRVWYEVKQEIPEDPNTVEIRVMAQQWAWTFTHPGKDGKLDTPDDIKTTDELYVQNDQMYVYHLESRDVMHDFSVPVFRLKQDAIPGRVITGWFQTNNHQPPKNEDGKVIPYDIQCAEMCGIGHGIMGARIYIQDKQAHTSWIANRPETVAASKLAQNDATQQNAVLADNERPTIGGEK
ncbi:MAG: cytochrome c oxidase subunit II [Bradymonadia bacterium]